ncbi:hypothetical protein TNCV_1175251 [Trichonephila clavipes]|nr:hypothetical protein TNCV_1175251 [Trichonephila clavipes]
MRYDMVMESYCKRPDSVVYRLYSCIPVQVLPSDVPGVVHDNSKCLVLLYLEYTEVGWGPDLAGVGQDWLKILEITIHEISIEDFCEKSDGVYWERFEGYILDLVGFGGLPVCQSKDYFTNFTGRGEWWGLKR